MTTDRLLRYVDKPISLVGLMGVGKTRIGRGLANALELPFCDTDQEVEKAAGCSIKDIHEQFGRDEFRRGERRVIERILREGGVQIVATGGTSFSDDEIRGMIKEHTTSIWLKADLDLMVERTSRTDRRPLLSKGDPREILNKMIDERYPIYEQADITVQSEDVPPHEVVRKAREALADFYGVID